MLYRKYFDDNQSQREFFDSIAGQCSTRTMSADDQGLFVEYETTYCPVCDHPVGQHYSHGGVCACWECGCAEMALLESEGSRLVISDSGQLSSFALPMAVAAIAMYLMHFMAAHGILQSLTMIGGH